MPRKPDYQPNCYYHLFNRGRSRLPIFHDDLDYLSVFPVMRNISCKYLITIIAYCLLPNHFHLLVRQNSIYRASLLPQHMFNGYSKRYNSKYRHSGTLFERSCQGRYVHNQGYLRHLCRYIHTNPLKHGIVTSLAAWPYSNVHEWLGVRHGRLVDHHFIHDMFHGKDAYRRYLDAYIKSSTLKSTLDYLEDWDFETD